MYSVLIKIDDTLPWIELKGAYQTRKEAEKAARDYWKTVRVSIVALSEKGRQMKAIAPIAH